MKLSEALNPLVNECVPGKRCSIGVYYITSSPKAVVLRESFDEDVLILYLNGLRMHRNVTVVSFKARSVGVGRGVPKAWFIPDEIDECLTNVCVDGKSVMPGEYRKYVFVKFALTHRWENDSVIGNLIVPGVVKPPFMGRWVIKWLKRAFPIRGRR